MVLNFMFMQEHPRGRKPRLWRAAQHPMLKLDRLSNSDPPLEICLECRRADTVRDKRIRGIEEIGRTTAMQEQYDLMSRSRHCSTGQFVSTTPFTAMDSVYISPSSGHVACCSFTCISCRHCQPNNVSLRQNVSRCDRSVIIARLPFEASFCMWDHLLQLVGGPIIHSNTFSIQRV